MTQHCTCSVVGCPVWSTTNSSSNRLLSRRQPLVMLLVLMVACCYLLCLSDTSSRLSHHSWVAALQNRPFMNRPDLSLTSEQQPDESNRASLRPEARATPSIPIPPTPPEGLAEVDDSEEGRRRRAKAARDRALRGESILQMMRARNAPQPPARPAAVGRVPGGPPAVMERAVTSLERTCDELYQSKQWEVKSARDQLFETERKEGRLQYVGDAPFRPRWGIDQVYVVHYSPQSGRRERMQRQLGMLGFEGATYVTGLDADHGMTEKQVCALYRPLGDAVGPDSKIPYWVSSTAKHHAALWDMEQRGYSRVLILEDDACVRLPGEEEGSDGSCKNGVDVELLKAQLPEKLKLVPDDMDVLFVGGCAEDHYNDNFRMIKDTIAVAGASRCVSAMVVSLSGARKILGELPFHSPYDIHLNQVMRRLIVGHRRLEVYWLVPQLMGQTDQGGSAGSEIWASILASRHLAEQEQKQQQ